MSLDALYPANGDNAIVHTVFIIEWLVPLSEADLRSIKELQPRLQHELPIMQESQAMSVTFTAQGSINAQAPSAQLEGIHFLKTDLARSDRVIRALEINRHNMVAMISDYDRWESVWESVSQWFQFAYEVIDEERQIQGLTLQYTDSFQWRDNLTSPDANEFFLQNSPYLPPYVYSTPSLWHTHNGYIEEINNPIKSKLINNINIDLNNHRNSLVYNIISSHKIVLLTPVLKTSDFSDAQTSFFEILHKKNKDQLTQILSSDVCGKIGLTIEE